MQRTREQGGQGEGGDVVVGGAGAGGGREGGEELDGGDGDEVEVGGH